MKPKTGRNTIFAAIGVLSLAALACGFLVAPLPTARSPISIVVGSTVSCHLVGEKAVCSEPRSL